MTMPHGGAAFQPALALLQKNGADWNVMYKGYRALHALIQERPHGETKPTPERLACLEWLLFADTFEIAKLLLNAGADPKALTKSWPDEVDAMYFATGATAAPTARGLLAAFGSVLMAARTSARLPVLRACIRSMNKGLSCIVWVVEKTLACTPSRSRLN